MNIDQAEKDKFNKIAEEWWDPSGKFAPLHKINPLRSNYINDKKNVNNLEVLDVACGGGLLAEALYDFGAKVTGVDISEVAIETAKLHASKNNKDISYILGEAESLLLDKKAFDVVSCLEAIEHVPDPELLVKTCSDLCKPGGEVFFSTINRNPKSFLFAIIGAEYVLRWLPIGTHDWEKFVKPEDLKNILNKNNLKIEKIDGMNFDIFKDEWNISKDTSINYIAKSLKV